MHSPVKRKAGLAPNTGHNSAISIVEWNGQVIGIFKGLLL